MEYRTWLVGSRREYEEIRERLIPTEQKLTSLPNLHDIEPLTGAELQQRLVTIPPTARLAAVVAIVRLITPVVLDLIAQLQEEDFEIYAGHGHPTRQAVAIPMILSQDAPAFRRLAEGISRRLETGERMTDEQGDTLFRGIGQLSNRLAESAYPRDPRITVLFNAIGTMNDALNATMFLPSKLPLYLLRNVAVDAVDTLRWAGVGNPRSGQGYLHARRDPISSVAEGLVWNAVAQTLAFMEPRIQVPRAQPFDYDYDVFEEEL